ncbi:flagellar hook-length control protein FliK [Cryobacterium cryoconiti]|uniref:Flagellar hook-length control protein FliK n=1 Tax=Cryobacterium cryoconiti TaxID=1259239 RepID=A0A4Y8JYC3_9MICO|nr:flagellar hook-length control protein FliK [Cryobacterium cryoconiti]TFD33076.1 flagellar hook-length control protein FliK [Cryobacterium cryoconiti]
MNALLGRMAATMPAGPAHAVAPAPRTGRSDTSGVSGAGSFAAVLQGTLDAAPAERPAVPAEKPAGPAEPTTDAGTDRVLDAGSVAGEPEPGTEPGTEPQSVQNLAAHPLTALLAPAGTALSAMLSGTGTGTGTVVADPAAADAGTVPVSAAASALEGAAPAAGISSAVPGAVPGAVPSTVQGTPATPAAGGPATVPAALPGSAEQLGTAPVVSTSSPAALPASAVSAGAARPGPGDPVTLRPADSATDVTAPVALLVPVGTPAPAAAPVAGIPAPAAVVPTPHVPLTGQVSRPLFTLVGAANGDHVMTISVSPDNLGPVTVRAHVSGDGIRVELFAPTDLARDALRAILPDLRRDLTGGGLNAQLTLSADDQASDSAAQWHDRTGAGRDREAGETRPDASAAGTRTAVLRTAGSHTIDVFA